MNHTLPWKWVGSSFLEGVRLLGLKPIIKRHQEARDLVVMLNWRFLSSWGSNCLCTRTDFPNKSEDLSVHETKLYERPKKACSRICNISRVFYDRGTPGEWKMRCVAPRCRCTFWGGIMTRFVSFRIRYLHVRACTCVANSLNESLRPKFSSFSKSWTKLTRAQLSQTSQSRQLRWKSLEKIHLGVIWEM